MCCFIECKKGWGNCTVFAGSPALVCGDLYQLSPVKEAPIYGSKGNRKGGLGLEC